MHSLGKHSLGEHEIPNARKVNPGPPVAIPGPHGGSFTRSWSFALSLAL
jgi:hypothetical protein